MFPKTGDKASALLDIWADILDGNAEAFNRLGRTPQKKRPESYPAQDAIQDVRRLPGFRCFSITIKKRFCRGFERVASSRNIQKLDVLAEYQCPINALGVVSAMFLCLMPREKSVLFFEFRIGFKWFEHFVGLLHHPNAVQSAHNAVSIWHLLLFNQLVQSTFSFEK